MGKVVVTAPSSVDPGFLYWLFVSPDFNRHLATTASGTKILHTSPGRIKEYSFFLPPLEEQREIASLLGALEDKIELNRRMNETLEAMARALFKSWFVDFDPVRAKMEGRQPVGVDTEAAALFPETFEDSQVGEVPAGWAISPLDGIASFLNGLAMQKYPATGGHSLPVIKIAELRNGISGSTSRAGLDVPAQYVVQDGDLLFSWSGTLDVQIWCGGPGALNQHLFKVTSSSCPWWFVYFWLKEYLPTFRGIAADKATTMGHIQRRHLSDALVPVPPDSLLRHADGMVAPLFKRVICNNLESRTVTEIRDMVLPKLLSGEIRLREAEAMVEAAS
jgi:type I restriction enzyme S subunit